MWCAIRDLTACCALLAGCLLGSPLGRLRTIRYSNVHRTFELRSCPHGFESLLFSYENKKTPVWVSFCFGAPWGTRTPNLRIRSARLYPIELMAHIEMQGMYCVHMPCISYLVIIQNFFLFVKGKFVDFFFLSKIVKIFHLRVEFVHKIRRAYFSAASLSFCSSA